MKGGIPLADSIKNLVKRIQRYDKKKHDEIRPVSTIQLHDRQYLFAEEPIDVTPTAIRQLCTVGRIPADFFINRLTAKEKESVFNRLFSEMRQDMMFRFSSDTLYGVTSAKYSVLDNIVLVDILREIRSAGHNLVPVKSILQPDHTKVRLIAEDVRVNGLTPMIEFTNSENGLGSLRLWAGVFRLICENGMIAGVSETRSSWRHIGNHDLELPDFSKVLNISTVYAEMLNDSKRLYLSASDKQHLLIKIKQGLGHVVADDFVTTVNEQYRGGETMYDTINGLTESAQHFSPEISTKVESFASKLLTVQ